MVTRFLKKMSAYIGVASGAGLVFGLVLVAGSGEELVDMWLIQYFAGLGFVSMLGIYVGFDEIFGEGKRGC